MHAELHTALQILSVYIDGFDRVVALSNASGNATLELAELPLQPRPWPHESDHYQMLPVRSQTLDSGTTLSS